MKKLLLSSLLLFICGMEGRICAQDDSGLIEIPQENVETGFPAATIVEGDGYTTYTATGDLQFAIKSLNVDVTGCDYVVIKFAEPVEAGSGWCVAFWDSQDFESIPAGATEYKHVFSEDKHPEKGVKNGVLPQLTLMTSPWAGISGETTIKVIGVYKHLAPAEPLTSTSVNISSSEGLEEITLEQDQVEDGDIHLASFTESDGVTTYTTTEGICIIIKMLDVDVEDCDYITYKFAEPIPSGIQYAVWSKEGNKCVPLDAGITEFKYVFAKDPGCAIADNVIPQVCLVTIFDSGGKEVKVKGVYKHKISDAASTRTYSFDEALDFTDVEGLEAYIITAFDAETATLTLEKVTQVPANTGLYLVGADGDYEIPVIESADAIETNLLVASGDGTIAKEDGSNTNLVLAGTGGNRGFHPVDADGNMGANKAYLQLPTSEFNSIAGARLSLVFGSGTTAITTVNDAKAADGAWYTVSGMKLNAKPTQKGVYVNNGKKFAIQ